MNPKKNKKKSKNSIKKPKIQKLSKTEQNYYPSTKMKSFYINICLSENQKKK